MRRFYSPPTNFANGLVTLNEGETRHLRDVLRITAGETVAVFDGEGREFECRVDRIEKRSATLSVIAQIEPAAPESTLKITVAAAVTPAEKFDLIVQKMVELGVVRLVPLITARTEVKAKAAAHRVERWRKIAFEASKQCGRARLMEIDDPIEFANFLDANPDKVVMFSERDGAGFDEIKIQNKVTVVYGPKGGWDDEELKMAAGSDAAIVTFGGRILRAETAAIALTAIIQHRFGDMN